MPFTSGNAYLHGGPYIMGIINVTPDSFSDGGLYAQAEAAIAHGMRLAEEGADILDIGGESTRPGALPVSPQAEQDRIVPVIEGLKRAKCPAKLSIDTRHSETMRACLAAGADMINDVTALQHDPDSFGVLQNADCPIILMHMLGMPQTMQDNPRYLNVIEDIFNFLSRRISTCETYGIHKNRLIIDPGIGFGKTLAHNLELLAHLDRFHDLGVPILLGASRKSFIEKQCGPVPPIDRLGGSVAAALYGLRQGVQMFRVHDVAQTRQAFEIWHAIEGA